MNSYGIGGATYTTRNIKDKLNDIIKKLEWIKSTTEDYNVARINQIIDIIKELLNENT